MELARQQKDAEAQLGASAAHHNARNGRPGSSNSGSDATRLQELTEEVQNLQSELAEQDSMWRAAYDKQVHLQVDENLPR